MKLFVFLCFTASQCGWMSWTGRADVRERSPVVYANQQECEKAGSYVLTHHGGSYQHYSPPFNARQFRCEPR